MAKLRRKVVAVEIPELQEVVYVRTVTVAEMRAISDSVVDGVERKDLSLQLFLCDEQGGRAVTLEQAREYVEAEDSRFARRVLEAGWSLNSVMKIAVENAAGN